MSLNTSGKPVLLHPHPVSSTGSHWTVHRERGRH